MPEQNPIACRAHDPVKGPEEVRSNVQEQDRSIVVVEPILEAETQYGPIFRRELLDVAYVAWEKALVADTIEANKSEAEAFDKRPDRVPSHRFSVQDIYGNEIEARIPKAGRQAELDGKMFAAKPIWIYNGLQRLGQMHSGSWSNRLCPYYFAWRYTDIDEKSCFEKAELDARVLSWDQQWLQSKLYSELTTFLNQRIGSMKQVNKVICFGLNCFATDHERSARRAYVQHLSAGTIRDTIAQQSGKAPKVYVQDLQYCTSGISWIQDHFGFEVVNDPEGFRAIDGHTFVITVAPNVPVRQIAMGLTHEYGGPVGMFCNAIDNDGTDCNGKGNTMEDGRLTSPAGTDDASPALWKYKQESMWIDHSDRGEEDFFGDMGVYLARKC